MCTSSHEIILISRRSDETVLMCTTSEETLLMCTSSDETVLICTSSDVTMFIFNTVEGFNDIVVYLISGDHRNITLCTVHIVAVAVYCR